MRKIFAIYLCVLTLTSMATPQEEELASWKSLTMEQVNTLVSEDEAFPDFLEEHSVDKVLLTIEPELLAVGIDSRFVQKYFDQISKRLYVEYVNKEPYKVKPLLNRVEKFFPFYHRELKKNDLPIEYAAISLIESMLIPDIVSKAKAVGLWQFIPTTAEHFKIFKCEKWKISRGGRWYCPKVLFDHRDNIIASTGAALRFIQSHLQKIKTKKIPANLQGLALLTSYNGGFGKVEKMLKTCAPENLFVNCEIESLPQETQIYLMRFVAALYFLKIYPSFSAFTSREDEPYPCISRHETALTTQDAEGLARKRQIDMETFNYYNKNPLNNQYTFPHEKYIYESGVRGCETPDEYFASRFYLPRVYRKPALEEVTVSPQTKPTWVFLNYSRKAKRLKRRQK